MQGQHYLLALFISFLCTPSFCDTQSIYCPQNHAYIKLGMSRQEVTQACGAPTAVQSKNVQVQQKVPVTQLIYNTLNQGGTFIGWTTIYNTWSLPSGSQGISLQINIMNGKVHDFSLNGRAVNSTSLCNGQPIHVGEDIDSVYASCGYPNFANETFVLVPIPSQTKPELWTYDITYQPSISLTFVDGLLQSIN